MANSIKIFIILLTFFIIFFSFNKNALAYDPLSRANNKVGIHILFPEEVFQAKELVNSSGGEWGYVTIPIQSSDKDLDKWQTFMDDCRDLRLIPILRLATTGDYFNTRVWEKPSLENIVDFANFLDSLEWPTKNRYVTIFNEVNRADEWGGSVSPAEYAEILAFSIETFKSKDEDFFIVSAGLDNAAPNAQGYMDQYDYLSLMEQHSPGIFSKLDGFASHSYPNPGFAQPPSINTTKSIYSFKYESNLVNNFAGKNLPVFITETGWISSKTPENKISDYFNYAFKNVWNDENVITVTPFLLRAGQGPFVEFSFIHPDGSKTPKYIGLENISKIKGDPIITEVKSKKPLRQITLPIRKFFYDLEANNELFSAIKPTKTLFKWLLKI